MPFSKVIDDISKNQISETLKTATSKDVEHALSNAGNGTVKDFITLVSTAAKPYLEEMASISQQLTIKRFGKTIDLYIPLYLSNYCNNSCSYCGFNHTNDIPRICLTPEQAEKEMKVIKEMEFETILLLTGEDNKNAGFDYLKDMVKISRKHFSQICMEVQPLSEDEYSELVAKGLTAVYVYQETYDKKLYPKYHPRGKKSDFNYRLDTPDRLGRAKVEKIGVGALLGLADWRMDSVFTAYHIDYLKKQYWNSSFSVSIPRMRNAEGVNLPEQLPTDSDILQLICAYRLYDENLIIALSTREDAEFRDNVFKLGVTSMSAGSVTAPGGYTTDNSELEQFVVHDSRSPKDISKMLTNNGYDPVWKNWDRGMGNIKNL